MSRRLDPVLRVALRNEVRSHPSHPLKLSTPPALLRESNRPAHLRGSCDAGTPTSTKDAVAVVLCTTTITMEYRRGLGDTDGLFGVGFDSCDDPLVGRVPDIVIFFFFGTDVGANRREERREGPDRTYGRERTHSSKRRNYATLNVVLL